MQLEEAQELKNSAQLVAADASQQVQKLDKQVQQLQGELLQAKRELEAAKTAAAQAPAAAPAAAQPAAPAVDAASLAKIVELEQELSGLRSQLAQAKAREEASNLLNKSASSSGGVSMGTRSQNRFFLTSGRSRSVWHPAE